MAWIDYKWAFDSISHVWILEVLNILKIFPVIITFLEYNIERWNTNFKSIHEKGDMLETYNLNINDGIFHRDSLSPLLFCIALIPFFIELKNTDDTKLLLE